MNGEHNRTDKAIIGIALVILLLAGGLFYFDGWMWGDVRDREDRIGLIATKNGDVRMKYEGELKWQSAASGQDLIYNDAVYTGQGSEAKLKLGDSEMTVSENTLVVLRREKDTNFLNLNYGTLLSRVAKSDKIVIDTGDGRPVEISTSSGAQVVVRKVAGKTEMDVVSGKAEMVIDGKRTKINKPSRIELGGKKSVAKVNPIQLRALNPLRDQTIVSDQPKKIEFSWAWEQPRPAKENETYTLEFAAQPSFEKIHARKVVKGALSTTMNASRTLSLFYRVRGPGGELSQTERVNYVRINKPIIVSPVATQKFQMLDDQNRFAVPIEIQHPDRSMVWYQVAKDSAFKEIILNQSTRETKAFAELALGEYHIRARGDFGQGRMSDWTESVPFRVEPKLQPLRLSSVRDRARFLIPNRPYPLAMYKAGVEQVKKFLRSKGVLSDFFPFPKGSFDEVTIEMQATKEVLIQEDAGWPESHLYPSRYKYRYQVSKAGHLPSAVSDVKALTIAMEPPLPVGEARYGGPAKDGTREVAWAFTPLLYAASYDLELSRDPAFTTGEKLSVVKTNIKTKLQPGDHYWRARARDAKGRIISDFSSPQRISIPDAVPQMLAQNEVDRRPAAVEKTVTRIEKVQDSMYNPSGWWAWAGTGQNYVDYRQSIPGRGTVSSHNVKGPSQYIETGYNGKSGYGGVFTYKTTPGEVLVGGAPIDNGSYTWSTISLEALMRKRSPFAILKSPVYYGLRMGIQQHKTPFLFLNADTELNMKTNEMSTGSLGVLAEVNRKRWTYYWLMRYQFPFSTESAGADQFSITPTFAFDGSVGVSYNFNKQLKAGLFWYGQWHQYNFVFSADEITNAGFQSLFYSNMDLRIGFDF